MSTQIPIKDIFKKAYLKLKIREDDFTNFKQSLKIFNNELNTKEHESNMNAPIIEFFNSIGYKKYTINTSNRIDLAISKDNNVEVLFELKRLKNTNEMIACDNLNKKALHEIILYYLRLKHKDKNYNTKHSIISDGKNFFVFDNKQIEQIVSANNKQIENFYINFEIKETLSIHKNEDFYKSIQDILNSNKDILENIKFTYFSLANNIDDIKDKQLQYIYKLLSPTYLLKLQNENDANSLNNNFYYELLYILGLKETKTNLKLITRQPIQERQSGSLIENTILKLQNEHNIENENELFEIALELNIVWLNRILFLKLLEARLLNIHNGDYAKFLSYNTINDFDDLNTLFFDVLAKPIDSRVGINKEEFKNIPYLNSSLFEPTTKELKYLRISNLKDNSTIKPNSQTILLKEITNDVELNTLKYLLKFLDSYDFGSDEIDEYKSVDNTLINSAVLGLIFEKLNGYKEGSFYTPSFITMYMCKKTIRDSLVKHFNEAFDIACNNFLELRNYCENNNYKEDFKTKANNIVNKITICDPSVGSGHFLVSALNELVVIKSELGLLNAGLNSYQITNENDELHIENENGFFDYKQNKEGKIFAPIAKIQKELFEIKQNIIENQLFGVDINVNSVKITRLRLWIELLKESYYNEDNHLVTLPNIDINIKCGNSLISRYDISDTIDVPNIKNEIQEYKTIVKNYREGINIDKNTIVQSINKLKAMFNLSLKASSQLYLAKTNTLKEYLKEFGLDKRLQGIDDNIILEAINIGKLSKNVSLFSDDDSLNQKQEVLKGKLFNHLLKTIEQIKIYEDNTIYDNAFEWRFEFPESLDNNGDFIGFDIVIGNPPYIRQENIKYLKPTLQYKGYVTYSGTADIYVYFYELSQTILKDNGLNAFICSNKFFRAKYGQNLRKMILDNTIIKEIVDFTGRKVFDNATVDTAITILQKHSSPSITKANLKSNEANNKQDILTNEFDFTSSDLKTTIKLHQNNLDADSFNFANKDEQNIKNKIEKIGTPLKDWDININSGIKTGFNEAFIIDTKTKDKLIAKDTKNSEIIKPLLRGRDIKKYSYEFADKWLINTHNGIKKLEIDMINVDDYPHIKKYLKKYFNNLKKRNDKGDTPYNLRNCAYNDEFEKEKIIYSEMTNKNSFTWDSNKLYINQTIYFITNANKYMLAILNSNIVYFYMKQLASSLGTASLRWIKIYVEQLPIPKISKEQQKPFIVLVDEIMKLKEQNKDTTKQEQKIDKLVCKLYGLTTDEVAIINNSFKIKKSH
jgi:type II restriction/modification system DNA methylase subunit YeeA